MLDMVLEHYRANLLEGRDDAGDLGEDIYAVGLLIHHPLHAPHLTLDPPEAVLELFFILGLYVTVGGSFRGGCLATVWRGHQFHLSLYLRPAQPQSVAHYRHAGERHSHRRKDRVQEPVLSEHRAQDHRHAPVREEGVENSCGHRDERNVVGERPEQVLLDVPHCGFRETDGPGHPAHVARDERHVCSLHGNVGAGTYGDAYVGLRESGGVVNAVADHADLLALGLQPLDLVGLVLGPDLRHNAVYSELPRDRLGGAAVIPGQHGDLEPQCVQSRHCLPGLVTHHVRYRHETRWLAVHRDEDWGLAFPRQLLSLREQTVLGDARLGEKAAAADENLQALDAGAYPTARDGLERIGLGEREVAIPCPSHDSLT